MKSRAKLGVSGGRSIWPMLAILLAAAVVPSICVLWFMIAAMSNERLAVRQRLSDVYRQKVETDQNEIAAFWSARLRVSTQEQGPSLFADIVRKGLADSAIVIGSDGRGVYPAIATAASQPSEPADAVWAKAEELEYALNRPQEAADEYARIAAAPQNPTTKARALAAQARCLVKSPGDGLAAALKLLQSTLQTEPYRNAADSSGRLIVPNVQLFILERAAKSFGSFIAWPREFQPVMDDLKHRLEDYRGTPMPPAQRLFLMTALHRSLGLPACDTLSAEELAGEYLAPSEPQAEAMRVTATAIANVWQAASEDGRAILLFRQGRLIDDIKAACRLDEPLAGAVTALEMPGQPDGRGKEPFLAVPASPYLPQWRLAVYLDKDPFAASAQKAEAAYKIAGLAAIAVIAALAAAMAAYLGRQIRLTRLKNDLIATVSHELKTPLASMRVLVDTLRQGRCNSPGQAQEYFNLIAGENERLSRLIDNFLTFSRMERNKQVFEFKPMDVGAAVQTAVAAMGDRFNSPWSRLELDMSANLPPVHADRDAIVTLVLNLLDNAWKYTRQDKVVRVRVFHDEAAPPDGSVCIEVSDNGVGMTRRAIRRIFDRFYQVDQTLSRKAGGCGLGLSIVKFILDAHGGTIRVMSQPGKGSVFEVRLPVAKSQAMGELHAMGESQAKPWTQSERNHGG